MMMATIFRVLRKIVAKTIKFRSVGLKVECMKATS